MSLASTDPSTMAMEVLLQQLGEDVPVAVDSEQLVFPESTLLAAKARWSEFWPHIEWLLQQVLQGQELTDAQYQQIFYGVLLLADVADVSKRALVLAWLDADDGLGSDLEYILGDALTDDLATVLYVLSAGDAAPLLPLLHSEYAGNYVKAAALAVLFAQIEAEQDGAFEGNALQVAALKGDALQAALDATIDCALACQQPFVLTELAIWCMTFGLDQYASKFQSLLRQNKLDTQLLSTREISRWQLDSAAKPMAARLVRPTFDILSLKEWTAFLPVTGVQATVEPADLSANALAASELATLDETALLALAQQKLRAVNAGESNASESNASESNGPLPAELTKALVGRNDPCPCGSGKKYKKCCL